MKTAEYSRAQALFLVCHGQHSPDTDPENMHLTPEGVKQVRETAELIRQALDTHDVAMYMSTEACCMETAEILRLYVEVAGRSVFWLKELLPPGQEPEVERLLKSANIQTALNHLEKSDSRVVIFVTHNDFCCSIAEHFAHQEGTNEVPVTELGKAIMIDLINNGIFSLETDDHKILAVA